MRWKKPNDHERRGHEKLYRPGLAFCRRQGGDGDVFVSEVDESDGSIVFFEPCVAAVNNISLDHKSLDELRALFRGFIARAQTAVLNLDNAETASLSAGLKPGQAVTYGLRATQAHLQASPPIRSPTGIAFQVKDRDSGEVVEVALKVPGLHNVAKRASLEPTDDRTQLS